jgi:hypothetical protein
MKSEEGITIIYILSRNKPTGSRYHSPTSQGT